MDDQGRDPSVMPQRGGSSEGVCVLLSPQLKRAAVTQEKRGRKSNRGQQLRLNFRLRTSFPRFSLRTDTQVSASEHVQCASLSFK